MTRPPSEHLDYTIYNSFVKLICGFFEIPPPSDKSSPGPKPGPGFHPKEGVLLSIASFYDAKPSVVTVRPDRPVFLQSQNSVPVSVIQSPAAIVILADGVIECSSRVTQMYPCSSNPASTYSAGMISLPSSSSTQPPFSPSSVSALPADLPTPKPALPPCEDFPPGPVPPHFILRRHRGLSIRPDSSEFSADSIFR